METINYPLDHVAIPSLNIPKAVLWYVEQFGAEVLYEDETWAFLKLGQGKLALVSPAQHPPHLAIRVDGLTLCDASDRTGIPIDKHRDGTAGIYISDLDGNQIELISYPPGQTVYSQSVEA